MLKKKAKGPVTRATENAPMEWSAKELTGPLQAYRKPSVSIPSLPPFPLSKDKISVSGSSNTNVTWSPTPVVPYYNPDQYWGSYQQHQEEYASNPYVTINGQSGKDMKKNAYDPVVSYGTDSAQPQTRFTWYYLYGKIKNHHAHVIAKTLSYKECAEIVAKIESEWFEQLCQGASLENLYMESLL